MRAARFAIVMAVACRLLACEGVLGLDDYDVVAADAGVVRFPPNVPRDGGSIEGPICGAGPSCSLPSAPGTTLVLYGDRNPTTRCPTGWTSTNVRADPQPSASACSCGSCAATVDCTVGPLPTRRGTNCTTAGTGVADLGDAGACVNTEIDFGSTTASVMAPTARVGACSAPATAVPSGVPTTGKRYCTLTTPSCSGEACRAPADLEACLLLAADGPCPASAPNRNVVGDDVTVSCPACSCTVTATCNGSLELYPGNNCAGTPTRLAPNACTAVPAQEAESYRWIPSPATSSCTKTPPADAGVSLTNPRTICCP